ncbi:hypothetical protein [Amaricoccus solimangrovi]|uniref:Uncharacterized protein n=1 Tax=Amaricoccus solimangrovi TaxID=2589815 RepID=A0A501W665_9RHOB|nr:hypothetical protein [Amaricoccus solimangrovi]TPE44125.1 hypothetical protein FJM51_23185 [Amaricoccus solimangrovi]
MTITTITVDDGEGGTEVAYINNDPATGARQDTGNTALAEIVAAIVSGKMQVQVASPLPAGTAPIGKLAANAGVNIGNVTVEAMPSLPAGSEVIGKVRVHGDGYEDVAASQTTQVLGEAGAAGDFISHVVVFPATTSPGAITLFDGASGRVIFAGGTDSVPSLIPFPIPLGHVSKTGAFKITTGANVSCRAVGAFS